jgi:hypothetical protein
MHRSDEKVKVLSWGNLMSTNKEPKKFIRDGAKYVCVKCKKKYFTRAEVEKCYDECVKKSP